MIIAITARMSITLVSHEKDGRLELLARENWGQRAHCLNEFPVGRG